MIRIETRGGEARSPAGRAARGLWRRLREPSAALLDVGERRRARLLASMLLVLMPLGLLAACGESGPALLRGPPENEGDSMRLLRSDSPEDDFEVARDRMVREQIEARGVRNPRVLAALRKVPRHAFLPESQQQFAYRDQALPIGHGQTISQPYVVATMTELAALDETSRVLEVGTGSGYQAAVLAEIAQEVFSIEIVEPLARKAAETLRRLGYTSTRVRHGDGYRGWPEAAPFDAILVTAAAPRVPPALLAQLVLGGRLVIPVGEYWQELQVHTRTAEGVEVRSVFPVRFVPMTGEIRD